MFKNKIVSVLLMLGLCGIASIAYASQKDFSPIVFECDFENNSIIRFKVAHKDGWNISESNYIKISDDQRTKFTISPSTGIMTAIENNKTEEIATSCNQVEAMADFKLVDAYMAAIDKCRWSRPDSTSRGCGTGMKGVPDPSRNADKIHQANFDSLSVSSDGKIVAVVNAKASGTSKPETYTLTPTAGKNECAVAEPKCRWDVKRGGSKYFNTWVSQRLSE